VVPDPDILLGHLDLHHNSSRVVDLIIRNSQAQVKVHEHQARSSRGVQARLGHPRRVALLAVGCISGGANRVLQVVIPVERGAMSGETAPP